MCLHKPRLWPWADREARKELGVEAADETSDGAKELKNEDSNSHCCKELLPGVKEYSHYPATPFLLCFFVHLIYGFLVFFFLFLCYAHGMWTFLGQGSNPRPSSSPHHCSDNARSLTY